MKFFLDTADIAEIRELASTGLVDGITTNPSLIAKSGRKFVDAVREICSVVPGPVSAEVTATDHATMLAEGRRLARLARNIAVKVPLTPDGLKTCKALRADGIRVNVTLCFSPAQAILAAKAGASFISPFVGRLDDINQDGMIVVRELVSIVEIHEIDAEVLAASIRTPLHVTQAALAGSHVATLPFKVFEQMVAHPLTDRGMAQFRSDWDRARRALEAAAQPAGGAPGAGSSR